MKRFFAILILCLLLVPISAFAAFQFDPGGAIGGSLGLPQEDAPSLVIRVIQFNLAGIGLTALIMILFGGFRYLTSAGNQDAIDSAKKVIRTAVIGLFLVFLAQAFFMFVVTIVDRVTS